MFRERKGHSLFFNIAMLISIAASLFLICTPSYQPSQMTMEKQREPFKTETVPAQPEPIIINETHTQTLNYKVLEDTAYYYTALDLIEKSNSSIYVVMYVMKYDANDTADPANDLIRALAKAEARNVSVNVILEDEISINKEAYSFLAENNVNVTFDPYYVRTHMKAVVIDNAYAIVGSHNWTESALWYNHEVSILIKDETIAQQIIETFNSIYEG